MVCRGRHKRRRPDGGLSERTDGGYSRRGGCVAPTCVVDAQDQREPTLLAGSCAGDRHRAEDRHLVLPTVLRHVKGIWEKLTTGNEDEAPRPLAVATLPGTGSLPSARRRNSGSPSEPTCCR